MDAPFDYALQILHESARSIFIAASLCNNRPICVINKAHRNNLISNQQDHARQQIGILTSTRTWTKKRDDHRKA